MIHAALICLTTVVSQAPATRPASADESVIRKAVAEYVEAFNRGDVDKLAAMFSENAQYIAEDGAVLKGRDEIRSELEQALEDLEGARLAVVITAIDFPRTRIAMVRGTSTLQREGDEPFSAPFRVSFANRDGRWLIRSIEEVEEIEALEQLADFIGTWRDDDEEAAIQTEWQWAPSRHFITRSFVATLRNGRQLSGTEVIGWDPAARSIRSWVFDSDGSFGQGVWSQRGDEWIVKARGVLPDGSRASAVYILTPEDQDTYTWESINREVDGEILPDIGPFTIVRSETQPADALSERSP